MHSGFWYISGLGGDRLPADGDDIDYYSIQSTSDRPPTGWSCSISGDLCNPASGDTIVGLSPAPILTVETCDESSCDAFMNEIWRHCDAEQTDDRRGNAFTLDGCGTDQGALSNDDCHQSICTAAQQTECYDEACAFRSYQWYVDDAMQQCHSTCRLDTTNTIHTIASCDTEDGGVNDATTGVSDYGHTEVAWWTMDSDSILTAVNEAGQVTDQVSHHDGQMVGAVSVVYDSDPARGFVLKFDGSNEHPGFVEVPPSPAWNLNEYTIMFWMNPNDVTTETLDTRQALLAHGETFDTDIAQYVVYLGPGDDGRVVIQLWSEDTRPEGDNDLRFYGFTVPEVGAWTHVAITRGKFGNGADSNLDNKVKIYINGEADANIQHADIDQVDIEHILTLGCRTDRNRQYRNFFQGRLDSIRLFDQNMQAAFIRNMYNLELQPVSGDVTSSEIQCDVASLSMMVTQLQSDCCSGDGVNCDGEGGIPNQCSPRCAAAELGQ